MIHHVQFFDKMTMWEPGGQSCAFSHPAIVRTSWMALLQVHSVIWP
jgi:hypothetical protein